MKNIFSKFAHEIQFNKTTSFENTKVVKANLMDSEIFEITFSNDRVIPFHEMENFLIHLNKNFKYKVKPKFNVHNPQYHPEEMNKYILWIINSYLQKPNLGSLFNSVPKNFCEDGKLNLYVETSGLQRAFIKIEKDLTRAMQKFGFVDFLMQIEVKKASENMLDIEKQKMMDEAHDALTNQKENTVQTKKFKSVGFGFQEIEVSQLNTVEYSKVSTKGKIFDINEIKTRTGMIVFSFSITDYKDAVYVKTFARNDQEANRNRQFQIGDWIAISGNYQTDAYSKERVILASTINQISSPENQIEDTADKKRVELSFRTKMSTMDGILTPTQIIKRAKKWKHKAVAIVDTGSVQSFPEFYNASQNENIKAIYGISIDVISKKNQAIYNVADKKLDTDSYVVFDLETTGLSATFDDIIEFGAVKIHGNQIVEKKQFFVKPTKSIPEFITQITGITNEDVKDAKPEKLALKDMLDFLGNNTLVAHNAGFDINFILEKIEKYGYQKIDNPVIDTMIIARITNKKAKKFRLESVASRYDVEYDSTVAHRADYDADVLAKVWLKMIGDLQNMGLKNQFDLDQYNDESLYKKAFSKEVTLLAKNQSGLKELFEFSSSSLTKTLFRNPTLFFEDLSQRKNILMGSGALKSKLVDLLLTGSRQQIRDEITKYDYIEVQPIKNFKHKIGGSISKQDLENGIKFIIQEAKRQGKMVVATGDVRYLDLTDKIYHQVYINAKGLGGIRHYLFRYGDQKKVYPDQEFLTTDQMIEAFNFLEDINLIKEIVVDNPNKMADMIEDIQVIKEKLYTPKFGDADKELEDLVYKNAKAKYGNPLPKIIEKRIRREIEPIKKYGFSVIYWISHLLVAKSLKDGYLVGSRGSVGSSFVATMSKITEVNPLAPHYICGKCQYSEFFENSTLNSGYDLPEKNCPNCNDKLDAEGQNIPFETFLGFNADKVPDIDLNFSGDYQMTIHNEVKKLFGEKHSFRAGTISTVAEKTAFGYVKAWAEETNKNISKAFVEFLAKGVAGTKRTTGQHPGGIIVIPHEYDVEDFTPINFPANDVSSAWKTTHFDFHAIHDNVLKLDLLGHDDPTAIKYLEKLTGVNAKKDISFQDENIIKLFSSLEPLNITSSDIAGEKTGAMGIPEFGTSFVRRMLKNAKVKSFGDLIAVSGLSHGTDVWTGNAELAVKNLNKELSDLISCRDNIMTDLMAKNIKPITSFSIMEKVRKGKGITGEEEKLLIDHGVEPWYIDSLKKIKYMFPKAHATAYVMMAWRIAWFKLYHPHAYYATYFTTRADVFDIETIIKGKHSTLEKLKELRSRKNVRGENALSNKEVDLIPIMELASEAFARKIKISNIDLKRSMASRWIIDEQTKELIPPFISIDGLGTSVADSIIKAREEKFFTSIEDLKKRTSLNKTSIEKLKELNALKNLNDSDQISLMDFLDV